ncbi:LamG-like jellyroll fold domain-containing protein [Halonatronum saccharophilum]|uniref:LamG-like jellyroll fold domain-containing protein n=1 Tax=Halonatronum saccharophilum TaxID=150060 RepID=UPI000484AF94|nr:LamG-like jellyroll fold domain-containing protein [Halonatronum saccharophilum]
MPFIEVSNKFKDNSKDFKYINDHRVSIINITKNKDITDYISSDTINQSNEEKSKQGKSSTNTLEFKVDLDRYESLEIEEVIEEGDLIQLIDSFAGEEITLFTGFVKGAKATHKNIEHSFDIKVYDKLFNGIRGKFNEDEVLVAKYVCNGDDKSNSLAHILAYKMGFGDEELNFDDVKGAEGNHLITHYIYWEKDKKILAEFTELVDAVCGKLFVDHQGKLTFMTPFHNEIEEDIEYKIDQNVKKQIQAEPMEAQYDKVVVNYSQFRIEEEQVIWQLMGQHYQEDLDLANFEIVPSDEEWTNWLKFSYVTPICIDIIDEVEKLFEDKDGKQIEVEYQLEYDRTGGKIRFKPAKDDFIYIRRFKMYGKPLAKIDGNQVSYTERDYVDNELTIDNKYIQTLQLAGLNAQYSYHFNCRDRVKYKFDTYLSTFIQLNNIVELDTIDIKDSGVVNRFSHNFKGKKTSLELIKYLPYQFDNSLVDTVQADGSDLDAIVRLDQIRRNAVTKYNTPPLAPENLEYNLSEGKVEVTWDEVKREDIKGYYIYIESEVGGSKKFVPANLAEFNVKGGLEYSIQVSAVTFNDIESQKSDSITVIYPLPQKADFIESACRFRNNIFLRWSSPQEEGNKVYEVRLDDNFGEEEGLVYLGSSKSCTFNDIRNREYTFYIKSFSAVGYSEETGIITLENPVPGQPLAPDASTFFEKIIVEVNPLNDPTINGYYLYLKKEGEEEKRYNIEKLDKYEFAAVPEEEYQIRVSAYDVLGEGEKSDPVSITVDSLHIPDEAINESKLTESLRGEIAKIPGIESDLESIGEIPENIEQRIESAENDLSDAKERLEGVEETVSENSTSIEKLDGEIKSKVSQTELDAVEGRVSKAETTITQQASLIESKVEQEDFDTLEGTVSSQGTRIAQTETSIESKAEQSEVDTISGNVSTNTSDINQNANNISTTVQRLDGHDSDISQINQRADEITSTVQKVNQRANQSSIVKPEGGTLFHFDKHLNSTDGVEPVGAPVATIRPNEGRFGGAVAVEEGTENLIYTEGLSTNGAIVDEKDYDILPAGLPLMVDDIKDAIYTTSNWGNLLNLPDLILKDGESFTLSCWAYFEEDCVQNRLSIYAWGGGSNGTIIAREHYPRGKWTKVKLTVNNDSGGTKGYYNSFRFEPGRLYTSGSDLRPKVFILNPQLEKKPFATSFVDGSRDNGRFILPAQLFNPRELTFAFYYKPHTYSGRSWDRVYQANTLSTGSATFRCYRRERDDRLRFEAPNGSSTESINIYDTFKKDDFNFIVITYSQDKFCVFIDGEYHERGIDNPLISFDRFQLGRDSGNIGNALFDELLILPYAVGEDTIKQWYESQAPFYDSEQSELQATQIKQLANEYTVKIQEQSNGKKVASGFGLALEDGISEFGVLADRFRIFGTEDDGEGQAVFALDTQSNKLYLLADLIADGSITSDKLRAESIEAMEVEFKNAKISGEVLIDTIGEGAEAHSDDSMAIGREAKATGRNSLALGRHSKAEGSDSVAIGGSVTEDGDYIETTTGAGSVAVGYNAQALGIFSLGLGSGARANNIAGIALMGNCIGDDAIAIGWDSMSAADSIALGEGARALAHRSIAVGNWSEGGLDSIALGINSKASSINSIAIGVGADTDFNQNAVVIGKGAKAENRDEFVLGNSNHKVVVPGVFSVERGNKRHFFAKRISNMNESNGSGVYILCKAGGGNNEVIGTIYGQRSSGYFVFHKVDICYSSSSSGNSGYNASLEITQGTRRSIDWRLVEINVGGEPHIGLWYQTTDSNLSSQMFFTGYIVSDNESEVLNHYGNLGYLNELSYNNSKKIIKSGSFEVDGPSAMVPVGGMIQYTAGMYNPNDSDKFYPYHTKNNLTYYIPKGWLVANGGPLPQNDYPELYNVYNHTYANHVGNYNSSTHFPIPDLRGQFFRGLDMGRGIDPEDGLIGAFSPRNVGDRQLDGFQEHRHLTGVRISRSYSRDIEAYTSQGRTHVGRSNRARYSTDNSDVSEGYTSMDGYSETRPQNIAIIPLIKY